MARKTKKPRPASCEAAPRAKPSISVCSERPTKAARPTVWTWQPVAQWEWSWPGSPWAGCSGSGPGSAQTCTSAKRSRMKRKRKPTSTKGTARKPAPSTASGSMWMKPAPSITPAEKESSASERRMPPRSGRAPPASEPTRMAAA